MMERRKTNMVKPTFLEAPVEGSQISGFFSVKESSEPLTPDMADQLADMINHEVETGEGVWINPLVDDGRLPPPGLDFPPGLKIHGQLVKIGGRTLKCVCGEVAIFPHREERKSA